MKDSISRIENELKKFDQYDLTKDNEEKLNQTRKTYEESIRLSQRDLTFSQARIEESAKALAVAEEASKRIETSKKTIAAQQFKIKEIEDKLDSLSLLKEAFGPNGIKAIVIDYILPDLEERINNILQKLSDFRIKLDTQKSGIGKDVVIEGLHIFIYNELGEQFDYDNYSGGEKLKISVAISEALAEIQNFGFRLLDELFIGLDEESIESFVEVINTLQGKFPQLVCISHLRSIQDAFDEKITVIKNKGNSQLTQ